MPADEAESVCPFCDGRPPFRAVGAVGLWNHEDSAVPSAMAAPLRHVEELSDLTVEEVVDMHRGAALMGSEWSQDHDAAINIVWNLGRAAGQSVDHIHCHILLRPSDSWLRGFSPRWWLKEGIRYRWLVSVAARLNSWAGAGKGRRYAK